MRLRLGISGKVLKVPSIHRTYTTDNELCFDYSLCMEVFMLRRDSRILLLLLLVEKNYVGVPVLSASEN